MSSIASIALFMRTSFAGTDGISSWFPRRPGEVLFQYFRFAGEARALFFLASANKSGIVLHFERVL